MTWGFYRQEEFWRGRFGGLGLGDGGGGGDGVDWFVWRGLVRLAAGGLGRGGAFGGRWFDGGWVKAFTLNSVTLKSPTALSWHRLRRQTS